MKAVDKFEKITGYNIREFFDSCKIFFSDDFDNISNYYLGGSMFGESFGRLEGLLKECEKIESLFFKYKNQLNETEMFDLLDAFGEICVKLNTTKNLSRWLRSSNVGKYNQSFFVERSLRDNENFEDVSESLGSSDSQNDWMEIAVSNGIIEEDYTRNSSPIFNVKLNQTINFQIENLVDNLVGKNILGKDIDVNFRFEDNDVAIVKYNDAVMQTINTIVSTLKGDIPEFKNDGVSNEFIGTNVVSIQYPTLFRNLSEMFLKDGRFKEVSLLGLDRVDDSVFMRIKIVTINNDSHITNIQL